DCSSCGTRGHWPTVSNRETNVSRNSIKHGIFSSSLLLGEESAKLYHSPFKGSHRVSRALPRARPTLTPAVFLKSNRCVFNRAVCHEKLSTGLISVAYGDSHTCVEEFDRSEPINLSA